MYHSSTRPSTSYHVTQFYQAFPALVLQGTNTGVRRPGYEATHVVRQGTSRCIYLHHEIQMPYEALPSQAFPRLVKWQRFLSDHPWYRIGTLYTGLAVIYPAVMRHIIMLPVISMAMCYMLSHNVRIL